MLILITSTGVKFSISAIVVLLSEKINVDARFSFVTVFQVVL